MTCYDCDKLDWFDETGIVTPICLVTNETTSLERECNLHNPKRREKMEK